MGIQAAKHHIIWWTEHCKSKWWENVGNRLINFMLLYSVHVQVTGKQNSGQPGVDFVVTGNVGTKSLYFAFGVGQASEADLTGAIQGMTFSLNKKVDNDTMMVDITMKDAF